MAGKAKKTAVGRKGAASDGRVVAAVKMAKSTVPVRRGNDLTVGAAVKTAKSAVTIRRGNELTVGTTVKAAKSEANVAKSKVPSVPPIVEEVLGTGSFSVEKFVECFDVLVEAAGGTKRLRDLTLELAVRGMLVKRDPRDGTGAEYLRTVKESKESARRTITSEELLRPDWLPESWEWAPLAEVFTKITDGTHHSPTSYPAGEFRYVSAKDIKPEGVRLTHVTWIDAKTHREIYSRCNPELGDVLLIKDGATTGVVTVNDVRDQFSLLSSVALLKLPQGTVAWLWVYFMRSPLFYEQARSEMKGAAITRLTLKLIQSARIPVPPLAEQKRIVARVDQLMALIDELEAKQSRKRELGARFTQASLEALTTAEGPEEFDAAWKRVVENWETVIDRAEKVVEIRNAILSMAFRGLISEQDVSRNALAEIRRKKPDVQPIDRSNAPYGIPKHWVWLHLSDVLSSLTDGDHQAPPQIPTGVPFLTIGNVSSGRVDFRDTRFVPREYFESLDPRRVPVQGDILYTVVGASYGRPVLVDEARQFCVQRHIAILRPDGSCERPFLYLFLRSSLAYRQATQSITGTAQPTVPLRPLRDFKVPVPPVGEQKRIVARIEQLMELCADLEAKSRRVEALASKLVEAVVQEMVS